MLPTTIYTAKTFIKSAMLFVAVLFFRGAAAQEKEVIHQNQQWIEYSAQLKLKGKYSLLADGGYRWIDTYLTGEMYYVRAGVEYAINDNLSVHAGFAHVGYFFDNLSQIEHRPYQELSIRNKAGKLDLYQRIRVEERIFEPAGSYHPVSYNWFNWRFRYMLMVDVPLFSLSAKRPDYRVSLGVGDEIFLNAGKNIRYNYFDQNRLLLSPTVHLGNRLSVSVTYMNQYAATFTPDRFIHSNVFWLQVRQKFDLYSHNP